MYSIIPNHIFCESKNEKDNATRPMRDESAIQLTVQSSKKGDETEGEEIR